MMLNWLNNKRKYSSFVWKKKPKEFTTICFREYRWEKNVMNLI